MESFKRHNVWKSFLFSRGMVLVVAFLVLFIGFELVSLIGKSMNASKSRRIAESQVTELSKKQITIRQKLEALKTADGRESVLREEYPVVSPGEHVVVITEELPNTNPAPTGEDTTQTKKNFWEFFKSLFAKKAD